MPSSMPFGQGSKLALNFDFIIDSRKDTMHGLKADSCCKSSVLMAFAVWEMVISNNEASSIYS